MGPVDRGRFGGEHLCVNGFHTRILALEATPAGQAVSFRFAGIDLPSRHVKPSGVLDLFFYVGGAEHREGGDTQLTS
ncbi:MULTISPECIES: hypothetical protein [unclassified Arthrobacter]|uniref:hypothetical protein n=1 Tax=unclassified Arthrobacter TaxID=235627 RepID=UPI002E0F553E|nr:MULTISPECIES: hypothetical protein [unclassified Arthrobacter]